MSGGVAYVLDADGGFRTRCNLELVEIESIAAEDGGDELRALVERHHAATLSAVSARLLADWPASLRAFVRVMPVDYKRALRAAAQALAAASAPAIAEVAHG